MVRDGAAVAWQSGASETGDAVAPAVMCSRVGGVPVAFALRRRRVRLLDLRGVDSDGPAFRYAVERLRERYPDAPLVDVTIDELLAAASDEVLVPPAGLIFHTPRSGSTLLANMLAAPASHIVVKQSMTINVLLSELVLASADKEESRLYQGLLRLDPTIAEALLALTLSRLAGCGGTAHGIGRATAPSPVIVKPTSWAINVAATLLRLFPKTPAIFLSRDPAAVVASMVATPPRHPPYVPAERWPPEAMYPFLPSLRHAKADIAPAEFYAHVWRSAVETGLGLPATRTQFLDYAELIDDPDGTLDRVTGHLHLTPSRAERAAMLDQLGLYSKARSGPETFEPAGRHHRAPLTDEQHHAVSAIVGTLPQQLSERR